MSLSWGQSFAWGNLMEFCWKSKINLVCALDKIQSKIWIWADLPWGLEGYEGQRDAMGAREMLREQEKCYGSRRNAMGARRPWGSRKIRKFIICLMFIDCDVTGCQRPWGSSGIRNSKFLDVIISSGSWMSCWARLNCTKITLRWLRRSHRGYCNFPDGEGWE